MAKFYDQENDEGGSYEPQHTAAEKGGHALNLNHGPTCDRCNDSVINDIKGKLGRITNFKLGHLESKMDKGKWR